MEFLISGKANKMIAYLLGAIMAKMQADSLPELVRMVLDHRGAYSNDTTTGDSRPLAPDK